MSKVIQGFHYDIGGRSVYEDRVHAEQVKTPGGLDLSIAVVADGVGGENKGERAAQLAVDTVFSVFRQSPETDIVTLLNQAVAAANQQVYAEKEQTEGASCTLSIAVIVDDKTLYVANVGDSRVYLCRNEKLTQLTIDHTFATVMPWQGKMSKELAQQNPRAEVLMRALGPREQVPADLGFYVKTDDYQVANERGRNGLPLKEGDAILVCSDGLIKNAPSNGHPYVKEEEVVRVLTTKEGEVAAKTLVSFALGRNADDNVSAAVLQMPDPRRALRARRPIILGSAAAVFVLLLAIFVINTLSKQSAQSEIADAREQAAAEIEMQRTAAAATAALTAMAAASSADSKVEERDARATEEAKNVEITRVALSNAATAEAVNAAAKSTAEFEANRCSRISEYQLRLVSEIPVLQPAPDSPPHVRGNPVPEITASWEVENTGTCTWNQIRLRTLTGGEIITPILTINQTVAGELRPNEVGTVTIVFDDIEEVQSLDAQWFIVVNSIGGDLTLVEQPPLTLKQDPWIQIVDPTATPTATPTSTPTLEPTSTPTPTPTSPPPSPLPPPTSPSRGG